MATSIQTLSDICWQFTARNSLHAALANSVKRIAEHIGAEAASIFMLHGDKLVCKVCIGSIDITGLKIGKDQGIAGRALAQHKLQTVFDVASDPDFFGGVDAESGFVTRSILCAPLIVEGEAVGAVQVLNKQDKFGTRGLFNGHDASLLKLLASFASMAIHNTRMLKEMMESDRMKRELEMASFIQRRFFPPLAEAGEAICGVNLPASQLSGDFYSYYDLPDGRIRFALGDVCGKGARAALLMTKTVSLFQALGKDSATGTAALMGQLNHELRPHAADGMFVTMTAGIFDPKLRDFEILNAGHTSAWAIGEYGLREEFRSLTPPLGAAEWHQDSAPCSRLMAGETLCLYSDGITEAEKPDGKMLGEKAFLQMIRQTMLAGKEQRVERLLALLEAEVTAQDDVTLLFVG